jgi:hypothetical protein
MRQSLEYAARDSRDRAGALNGRAARKPGRRGRRFDDTGNGERFVKQMLGVDVDLPSDWELETDYVIRYDSQGASGSDTAEAWLGLRRRF